MTKEEDWQQKYMQFQMMQQQLEQISQQMQLLNSQDSEMQISIDALETFEKTKKDTDFLAPIANGIFVKGELKDTSKLVVNVGSNVTVEKTVPQVIDLLKNQQKKISDQLAQGEEVMQTLGEELVKIYNEVEAHEA